MPKFKYTGGFAENTQVMNAFGYAFAEAKAVDVPEEDEQALQKLRNNPFFEEQGAKAGKDNVQQAKQKSAEDAEAVERKRLEAEAKERKEEQDEQEPGLTDKRNMDQVTRQEAAENARIGQDGKQVNNAERQLKP